MLNLKSGLKLPSSCGESAYAKTGKAPISSNFGMPRAELYTSSIEKRCVTGRLMCRIFDYIIYTM